MTFKRVAATLLSLVVLLGIIEFFSFSTKDSIPEELTEELNKNQVYYRIKAYEYDHNINFCGEVVPLQSQDIYERFDYEVIKNSYWHSEMMLYFKRSGKYFPIIEPILKKYKIPADFKYLVVVESGMDNVVSPAGAAGFWQLMPKTAQEYGLEVESDIDQRYKLELATEAACKYILESYKKFNSWTLVAASYNMGMTGLQKKLNQQETDNYYNLLLNSETARYVFRILAIKDIFEDPAKYGFNLTKKDKYKPIKTRKVEVTESITDLYKFGEKEGVNYKIIRICNPWIKSNHLVVSPGKKYIIDIPTENFYVFDNMKIPHDTTEVVDIDTISGK